MREHTIAKHVAEARSSYVRLILSFPKGTPRSEETFHESMEQAGKYVRELEGRGRFPRVDRLEKVVLYFALPPGLASFATPAPK